MANLTDDDRGQLILVAAFAIAVIFVSMALIVNSAIFTENLASRGETTGSDGALSMRAMVETNAGDNLEAVNRNYSDDGTQVTAFEESVEQLSVQTSNQQSRSGRLVTVEYLSHSDGTRIVHNDSSDFREDGTATDYTLASNVERAPGANGTRAFRINATTLGATGNSSAFEIKVNQTGATANDYSWRARIYRNVTASGEYIHVRTIRNDTVTDEVANCDVPRGGPSAPIRIDVTAGTVQGQPCEALRTRTDGENFHFGAGTDASSNDYDINFRNADQISGNFSMTVRDDGGLSLPLLDLFGSGGQPFEQDAIYDATIEYTYTTSDLRYETEVRVAPGEPDV